MDADEVQEQAGLALDRQDRGIRLDASGRPFVQSRVPETRPTPLTEWFIYLSIGVLICGVVAIAALELGSGLSSPVVKASVLVGGALLIGVTLDAIVRIWRAAWAWMPIDRGRGLFRLLWAAVLAASLVVVVGIMFVVATA